jgi:hypothetical protein
MERFRRVTKSSYGDLREKLEQEQYRSFRV